MNAREVGIRTSPHPEVDQSAAPSATVSAQTLSASPRPHVLDELRAREYARLDRHGHVYLDYTGAGLYAESQVRAHLALLSDTVFGNPHSMNPTSTATTELVERTRRAVLSYFRASPDEYEAIFTLNASGALKLVGESYPFSSGSQYLLTYDNHNSVNGIREFAREKGASFRYVPITDPDLRIDDSALLAALDAAAAGRQNLFAYPAQSNFSGVQHSLDWIRRAQEHGWDVLLDAAAFVPTNRLDLSLVHPDFVALSFYKMFGYPTGVGCLIVRKQAAGKLHRPWFAGGTVLIASARAAADEGHGFAFNPGEAAFEDGTVNYLSIPAVEIGLRHIESVGIESIHEHVGSLTDLLLTRLQQLYHQNGVPLVHVYGPVTNDARGGTIAMNFFDAQGALIHPKEIEREAGRRKISLRTGCHCNPGAGETALHMTEQQMASLFRSRERMRFERFLHAADAMKEGVVRASLGIVSNVADVDAFLRFARHFAGYLPPASSG
ncbi:MAG TPA: aminotransferase class V-fold PLP-dependent enzyme [Chloroflexota bacterium]